MRVQFLNPPVHQYAAVHYVMNPPLGLPILAAVLKAAGHQCGVTDLEALQVSPTMLGQAFAHQDQHPDWVGFTALTSSARGMKDCISELRQANYQGRIVVGGVHATLVPEEVLALGVDLVVTGECEGNIVALLESGATGIHKGVAMPIENIPAPDWLSHSPVPGFYMGNMPYVYPYGTQGIAMASRGCPWHCVMCGNTIYHGQKIRYRPPKNVAAELKTLRDDFAVRNVFMYDDEMIGLPLPTGWMTELADRIEPLNLTWKCQGRCSQKHITEDLLRDMYRAGCRVIMWGVESFSPRVLKNMKKGTTPDDNWHSLRLAKKMGIKNFVLSMIGNYKETDDDLAETAGCLENAYKEGLIDYRQTTVVTALPGTELETIQKREGWYHTPPVTGPQMHTVYQNTPTLPAARIGYWMNRFDEVCPVLAN